MPRGSMDDGTQLHDTATGDGPAVVLEKTGHALPWERPDRFAELIDGFLAGGADVLERSSGARTP